MEEQRQGGEAVTYVGGLGDQPRPNAWPYLALGLLPVVAGLLVFVFWGPLRTLGGSAGKTIAPYSLLLTDASWSSNDMIATVPVGLTIGVSNTDQRTINGITLRFTKLDPSWQVISATSPNAHGVVQGASIFFPNQLRPRANLKMSIVMRPASATESDIGVTLAAGHDANAAHVDEGNGTAVTTVLLLAKVRKATDDDAYAQITALYDPLPNKDQQSGWQIHVANAGPIAINQIQLVFPPTLGSAFEILYIPSQATLLPDGNTLQFNLSLPPGGQTILYSGIVPHASGHFQIPIQVYLEKSMVPLIAPDGGPPITVDLTVS